VADFSQRMKSALEEARAALAKAKDDMARYYNQHRSATPTFCPGDKVFLDSSDLKTTRPTKKLAHRYVGPFLVVRPVGTHAYELRLPPSMSHVHPVFHVVKLSLAPEDPFQRQVRQPPPPIVVGDELEYNVEKILDSRLHRGKLQFLVKWQGYGYEENSWEADDDVHAPRLIRDFYRHHPGAPRRIAAAIFNSLQLARRDVVP
jgi:hypothetical protein